MFGLLKGSMSFGGSVFWRMVFLPCCQICEWGLLKRKQCCIYVKGTKMSNSTTKKNQHKNGNAVVKLIYS
jgi:hypothetical protein